MELIKELLKAVAEYSQLNREEFLETVKKAQTSQQSSEITRLKSRLTEAKKKAEMDAKKEEIRQEDIAKGVFVPVSLLPPAEPKKGVASA